MEKKQKSLFATRLRAMRSIRKFTQLEMSQLVGISYTTYRYYESGRFMPLADILRKIAIVLNVSADYLLGLSIDYDPHKSRKRMIGLKRWKLIQERIGESRKKSIDDFIQEDSKEITEKIAQIEALIKKKEAENQG